MRNIIIYYNGTNPLQKSKPKKYIMTIRAIILIFTYYLIITYYIIRHSELYGI